MNDSIFVLFFLNEKEGFVMNEKSKIIINRYIFILAAILVLDILTIITNIYISPVLENFGMPDIFIYIKLLITLTCLVLFILFYKEKFILPSYMVNIFLLLVFFSVLVYFFSIFVYKMVLLNQVSNDILDKILKGNPSLVIDVSRKNYQILQYVIVINSGVNSEFVLLIQNIAIQYALSKVKNIEYADEPFHQYDEFLYDKYLNFLPTLLLILSFLSINLFSSRYDLLESFEMGISLLAFAITVPSTYLMQKFFGTKNSTTTKSRFVITYLYILIISMINIILYLSLIGINVALIILNRGSYRIITSVLALVVSIIMLIKSKFILSLENK
jgi:hypothetical protein